MLTDAELRNTRGKSKAYKKTDRDGLYVLVTPSGGIAFTVRLPLQREARDGHLRVLRADWPVARQGAEEA